MEGNTPEVNRFGQDLYRKIWVTRGARFNAHQRLSSKHNWSIAAVSFLSSYVIILTLIQYRPIFSLTIQQNDIISIAAIIIAIFIIVLTLLESSKSHEKKALEFHTCARDISPLYIRIQQILSIPPGNQTDAVAEELREIAQKYEEILNRCPENHAMFRR